MFQLVLLRLHLAGFLVDPIRVLDCQGIIRGKVLERFDILFIAICVFAFLRLRDGDAERLNAKVGRPGTN